MPKDRNFLATPSSYNSNNNLNPSKIIPSLNAKHPPAKKRNKANSIMWLQEAYNTARGETALWVAVITQAMMDATSRCKKSESRYNKHEATCWLTGNSKDFIDVCLCAGMNPDYVRRKAKNVLSSSFAWRAEAGKGKRYHERKKYREKQMAKTREPETGPITDGEVIFLNFNNILN
jgi:hypothetical protein